MAQSFLEHLKERNLVAQASHEDELGELLKKGNTDADGKRYAVYAGFDPTARSLHVGHLVVLLALRRAQDCGLTPIVLFGGATALIGDPTGRTDMRPMQTRAEINESVENFKKLVHHYFRYDVENKPVYVNNIDWTESMTWIDFACNVGVHFTIARLLASEFGKTRLENGLTFMELSYQLMQANDFLVLNKEYNCILQIGGNDQWSNILAGADLIRRVSSRKAFALTTPLLAGKDGRKYGKTAGNAYWIDSTMLSPYEFFQFVRNIPDDDVELFFRAFLNNSMEEIQSLSGGLHDSTGGSQPINVTKEKLAYDITKLVHGQSHADEALAAARALFAGQGLDLSAVPTSRISRHELTSGLGMLDALVRAGVCGSKGDARRLIQGNGLSLNGEKVSDPTSLLKPEDFETEHKGALFKKGKKDYSLIVLE